MVRPIACCPLESLPTPEGLITAICKARGVIIPDGAGATAIAIESPGRPGGRIGDDRRSPDGPGHRPAGRLGPDARRRAGRRGRGARSAGPVRSGPRATRRCAAYPTGGLISGWPHCDPPDGRVVDTSGDGKRVKRLGAPISTWSWEGSREGKAPSEPLPGAGSHGGSPSRNRAKAFTARSMEKLSFRHE
jgi:hypothetical protein